MGFHFPFGDGIWDAASRATDLLWLVPQEPESCSTLMALVPCGFSLGNEAFGWCHLWAPQRQCVEITFNIWRWTVLQANLTAPGTRAALGCGQAGAESTKKGIYKEEIFLLCIQKAVLFPPILLLKPKISLDCTFCPESILEKDIFFVWNWIKLMYF